MGMHMRTYTSMQVRVHILNMHKSCNDHRAALAQGESGSQGGGATHGQGNPGQGGANTRQGSRQQAAGSRQPSFLLDPNRLGIGVPAQSRVSRGGGGGGDLA